MSSRNDADYYERRERRERLLAAAAVSPEIRAVHLDMADNYAHVAREARSNEQMMPRQRAGRN